MNMKIGLPVSRDKVHTVSAAFFVRESLIKSGAQDTQSDFSSDCMKTTPLG